MGFGLKDLFEMFQQNDPTPLEGGKEKKTETLDVKGGTDLTNEIREFLKRDPKSRSKKDFYDLLGDLNRFENQERLGGLIGPPLAKKEERAQILRALDAQYPSRAIKDDQSKRKVQTQTPFFDSKTGLPSGYDPARKSGIDDVGIAISLGEGKKAILDQEERDAQKGFFGKLKDKYNDPKNKQMYDNMALAFAQKATAPLNPGENRGLLNTAIDSVVEGKSLTASQQAATTKQMLDMARAQKELRGDEPASYKEALYYVTKSLGLKEGEPGYMEALGQAMRDFGIKDLTSQKVAAFKDLIGLEQQLEYNKDPKDPKTIKIQRQIDMLKSIVFGQGGGSSTPDNVINYYD